ncbi:hypothetical protein ACWCY1_34330 [Streptomyces goshikiensis]
MRGEQSSKEVALPVPMQADALDPDSYARSVGLRMTVLATTHFQQHDLDQGFKLGHRAVDILGRIVSARNYVADITTTHAPWRRERPVAQFLHRTRTELAFVS